MANKGGGDCRGLRVGDCLDDWNGDGLVQVELCAQASFGIGDGTGFDAGDEFLEIGVGLRRASFVSFVLGGVDCLLNREVESLFLLFALPLIFIPLDFVEQLPCQGLAFFALFGLEELGGGRDVAEGVVLDCFFDGIELFAISFVGMSAGSRTGLSPRVGAGGAAASMLLARQIRAGNLETPEQEAGLFVVDGFAGDCLKNFSDGEQKGGTVLGHGQLYTQFAEGDMVRV